MIALLFLLQITSLAEPYDTPYNYYPWWLDVAECAGYHVTEQELDKITFWHVNAPSFTVAGIDYFIGYAYIEDNEIYIARAYKQDEKIVKHEMLHFILWWRKEGYDGLHTEEFERCGL